MATYVIGIKRDHRHVTTLADVLEDLAKLPGVSPLTEKPRHVAYVAIDDAALAVVQDRIGARCDIEPLIPHDLARHTA